jgi:hypothetical protein
MKFKILVIILLAVQSLFAQDSLITGIDINLRFAGYRFYDSHIHGDFKNIDTLIVYMPKNKMRKIEDLNAYINSISKNDYEKVRAMYMFVGQFLIYDNEKYEKIKKKEKTKQLSAQELLTSKKGVCGDVSEFIKVLCKMNNIPCLYITGYTKQKWHEPHRRKVSHAWNALRIDSTWYLMDATWGMKNNTVKEKCQKKINPNYFLTHPIYFIQKHLPADPALQLIPTPITYKFFKFRRASRKNLSKALYDTNYHFTDTLDHRLLLSEDQQILASAISAYQFNPKNKYIIGEMLFWHAEELMDTKRQKKRKFSLEEMKHAREVYVEAQEQFQKLDTAKGKGISNYIQKKVDDLTKKIEKEEKRLTKKMAKK